MAIVEDEVRHESGEENEIEVVVEEDDQDSGDEDSEDDGSDDEEMLGTKVALLEQKVNENPYNYDDHIELIQALWSISELDRWREAFARLQKMSLVSSEHWLMRLQTETSLAHFQADIDKLFQLFEQAMLDCYSIPILTEWCHWSLHLGDVAETRKHFDEIMKRAGADPLSGKIFWDARKEFERTHLETLKDDDPELKEQQNRVLYCVEEVISRPLLHNEEAWAEFEELATKFKDKEYVEKVKQQHEAAVDFLQKITAYEDQLLTVENIEERCDIYQEYIKKVKRLAEDRQKYGECDANGILKVLYDRVTTECLNSERCTELCVAFAKHVHEQSSRATYRRVLETCARRRPNLHTFWTLLMRHSEKEGKDFDEIKLILERALARGMESFKEGESLWMSYLECARRHTDFDDATSVDRLRRTFRLAWDSLAEAWGAESNDCGVPVYWARLEYGRVRDHVKGREIFEEIFKYGDNKTASKYWETLLALESARQPPPPTNKLRDLHKRAVRAVEDYPRTVCDLWLAMERDLGSLDSLTECYDVCEEKLKVWRDKYEYYKQKNQKAKGNAKGKQNVQNKKTKFDKNQKNKEENNKSAPSQNVNKSKRKLTEEASTEVKRKRESEKMETDGVVEDKRNDKMKRPHSESEEKDEVADAKRKRTDSSHSSDSGTAAAGRDACTLFVSNLDFNIKEDRLREKLAEYGDIVSLRLKTGIKSFGGSICYCQYKTSASVEEALKHDRTPLDGRPMFLSRYAAKKTKQTFKYATEPEKNKLFVKNLPFSRCTKEQLTEVFEKYGKLKDVRIVTYKDGKPKGLAYVEYEDEQSAAVALEKTDGLLLEDRKMEVAYSAPPPRAAGSAPAPTLGQPKRETGGMRRTQISSFIPRVLQTPTTSSSSAPAANGQKLLSNSDFRNMLLKKYKKQSRARLLYP